MIYILSSYQVSTTIRLVYFLWILHNYSTYELNPSSCISVCRIQIVLISNTTKMVSYRELKCLPWSRYGILYNVLHMNVHSYRYICIYNYKYTETTCWDVIDERQRSTVQTENNKNNKRKTTITTITTNSTKVFYVTTRRMKLHISNTMWLKSKRRGKQTGIHKYIHTVN